MPNPLRELAQGDPLYTSFVNYFADDVSGNRSKAWNKHWNAYLTHASLPRELLQQEFHHHLISTSPNATVAEQFMAFKQVVEATHKKPVAVRDGISGENVRFRISVNCNTSDNPMQSETSGHIGVHAICFCRKCRASGTARDKESDDGFDSLFHPGLPRTKDSVIADMQAQVKAACLGVAQTVKDMQTETGTKDAYLQFWIDHLIDRARTMQREDPTRSKESIQEELWKWAIDNQDRIYSPFFSLDGFDPTKDTPIEILHTILLGVAKYAWHGTHLPWKAEAKEKYAVRLQATDITGLSIPPIRANYIMQYAGSLIGRQFKTVLQTIPFHIYDLAPPLYLQLWICIGELAALLWFPEIKDMEQYTVRTIYSNNKLRCN